MPDYYGAAQRHWDDAKFLHDNRRLPNADQLFGLSAECSLKAVMLALGMPMHPSGNKPQSRDHGHINILWDEFGIFATGRGQAHYASMLGTTNPFVGWDVGHRYEPTSIVSATDVFEHKNAADIAMNCMIEAIINGVV